MTNGLHTREQRLRKEAELQSLQINLASLRKQEATYIGASAFVPEMLGHQVNEARREIQNVERELIALMPDAPQSPAREAYWEGYEAELAHDLRLAEKLYRKAARYGYHDADTAAQSVRHALKLAKNKAPTVWDVTTSTNDSRRLIAVGVVIAVVLILGSFLFIGYLWQEDTADVVAVELTATPTEIPAAVILIVPDTATPPPTSTPTETPRPTLTPFPTEPPTVAIIFPSVTPTMTPTPAPTLRPAPRIIEPRDGLVWEAGAVVFEFERQNLAMDELYCLDTLRGFDQALTENWSYLPDGSRNNAIVVEAQIFQLAKVQNIQCIIWSARIGRGSCRNPVSESTETRVIGMPRPCDLSKVVRPGS